MDTLKSLCLRGGFKHPYIHTDRGGQSENKCAPNVSLNHEIMRPKMPGGPDSLPSPFCLLLLQVT